MEDAIREGAICPKCGHPKAHGQLVCHTCRGECDCGAKLEPGRKRCDDCIAQSMGYQRERRGAVVLPGEYADASLVDG